MVWRFPTQQEEEEEEEEEEERNLKPADFKHWLLPESNSAIDPPPFCPRKLDFVWKAARSRSAGNSPFKNRPILRIFLLWQSKPLVLGFWVLGPVHRSWCRNQLPLGATRTIKTDPTATDSRFGGNSYFPPADITARLIYSSRQLTAFIKFSGASSWRHGQVCHRFASRGPLPPSWLGVVECL